MSNPGGPRMIFHEAGEEYPKHHPAVLEWAARRRAVAELARFQEIAREDPLAALGMTQDMAALMAELWVTLPDYQKRWEAFLTELPRNLITIRHTYIEASAHDPKATRLEVVAVDGSLEEGARLGYFRAPLHNGSYGYLQRRPDDCLRAALATCAGAPMPQVPDLSPDRLRVYGRDPEEIERFVAGTIGGWIEQNKLTIRAHPTRLPVDHRCWIGIAREPDAPDETHCVVMKGRDVIFDTSWLVPPRADEPLSWHGLDDIELGLTIERR